jgi:hypothetical protein
MSTLDDQLRGAADAVHQRMEHLSIPEFGDDVQGIGKAGRSTAALAVLGAGAVVIIIAVVVAVTSYGQHKPSKVVGPTASTAVRMPDVVGMQQGSAVHVLAAAGLKSTIQRVFNDSVPARLVIAEQPLAGSSVSRATTITLVVSNGPTVHVAVPASSGTRAGSTTPVTAGPVGSAPEGVISEADVRAAFDSNLACLASHGVDTTGSAVTIVGSDIEASIVARPSSVSGLYQLDEISQQCGANWVAVNGAWIAQHPRRMNASRTNAFHRL